MTRGVYLRSVATKRAKTPAKAKQRKTATKPPPQKRTKRRKPPKARPVTKDELLENAIVLRDRLTAYIARWSLEDANPGANDAPGVVPPPIPERGGTAPGLEPLLRYYAREYPPRQQELRVAFLGRLASAAWQLLLYWPDLGTKDKDALKERTETARTMVQSIATMRREDDPDDAWSDDCITEIDTALSARKPTAATVRKPGAGRRTDEITRVSRVLEIVGDGYFSHEMRRGVRGPRRELLKRREEIARLIVTNKPG